MGERIEERCFRFKHHMCEIRVWTTAESISSQTEEVQQRVQLGAAIQDSETSSSSAPAKVIIARALAKLPFVSAVEVTMQGDNAAVLVYSDWP